MTSVAVIGSTGLVGAELLKFLLKSPSPSTITTITRRELPAEVIASAGAHRLNALVEKDSSAWSTLFTTDAATSKPTVVYSGLGTTLAAAGSFEKQYVIDHDVNVDIAKAAKAAGASTFVLISSNSASVNSRIAYSRMKGETERDIEALGFERVVFVRPGLILGNRTESRPAEAIARGLAGLLGKVGAGFVRGWAQPADMIARAAVRAGLEEGKKGVEILEQAEIVKLGAEESW